MEAENERWAAAIPGLSTWGAEHAVIEGPGGRVRLSAREWSVLRTLAEAAGAPVPRDLLGADGREVDFAVRRIRRKIEHDPSAPRIVQTVHGTGYRLGIARELPAPAPPRPLLVLRDRQVDLALGLVLRLGEERPLTTLQREALRVLVEAGGEAVPRDALARAVWGHARGRNVERVIHELRQRLEAVPARPVHLRTAPAGYRWVSERPRTNLAGSPERTVGRAVELAALLERAAGPGFTLVLGPPGIGKTHLARRACHLLAERRPGGAWWVDASPCGSTDLLCQAIARTLGLGERVRPAVLRLELRRRPPLALVLDGVEPADGLAALVAELVGGGAGVLATSTHAVDADHTVALGGLGPDEGRELYHLGCPVGVDPGPDDAVDGLVAELEGHPLAIGLVSRRARAVPSEAWTDRDDRLGLLALREPVGRHGSLWAAFDRSLHTTPAAERRALLACATFEAPFTADAARAVAGADRPLLDRLVDRSLLGCERGEDGPVYRLHALVRAWLRTLAPPDPATLARRRRWFLDRAAALTVGPEAPVRREVDRTLADLLDVSDAVDPADAAVIVALLHDCYWLPDAVRRERLDRLLALPSFPGVARLWRIRVSHRLRAGDVDGARAALDRAIGLGLPADGWSCREARLLLAVHEGGQDALDPGPERPSDPSDAVSWAGRRGRFLVDRAMADGRTDEALSVLRGAIRASEARGSPARTALLRGWYLDGLSLAGADDEWVTGEVEGCMLALEAAGHRRHAANVAWRVAIRRAVSGRRAQAQALADRHRDQLDGNPILAVRVRIVHMWISLDGDPAVLLPELLELQVEADALGDAYGRSVARLFSGVTLARLGRPAEALAALDLVDEGHFLPAAAAAVAAVIDRSRPVPARLPVAHWANAVVAYAEDPGAGAGLNPLLRALAARPHGQSTAVVAPTHDSPSGRNTSPQSTG